MNAFSIPYRSMATLGLILLLSVLTTSAQEEEPARECAECHLDVVADWQESIHAGAYHDAQFQAAWQKADDIQCLACHTTGFVPRTGDYAAEGVTCTACHGQTPADHPPEPMSVDPGVEICADCHTTTFTEWERSKHGEQQLACTTCHAPHTQTLRFETANALCLNCHDEARDDFAHLSHTEQTCIDCHWHRSVDETQHVLSGNLMPTGHDSQVETRACIDCHTDQAEGIAVASVSNVPHPLLEAQVRIGELEAEVQTARAQGDNQSIVQLVQGLLFGAVLAGVGIGLISRRLRR